MNQSTSDLNRRAAWRWGSFVVGLLSIQVAGGIMAVMLASSDESVAVVPNYHEKALHWDDEVAVQTASKQLGWNCEIRQTESVRGSAGLHISLTDRDGSPIQVSSGELRIYRHVRAADVRRIAIPTRAFGVLTLSDCFDYEGLWQVAIDVTDQSNNRFVDTQELYIDVSPSTARLGESGDR